MGVVISKPAINLREQLTELKAQQGYEERQFHFDNLVTNGTFDTDLTGWSQYGSGDHTISLSSGRMDVTRGTLGSGNGEPYQALATEIGKVYQLSFNVSGTVMSTIVENALGGTQLAFQNVSVGPAEITFTATEATTYIRFLPDLTGSISTIDDVSVYTSDGTDVAFTMPKSWKPLHVFEDGVLQREGSAEDYEVTFDGFNYYVKPTVANPGARNTVIGVRA
jgi:hypothetical protein